MRDATPLPPADTRVLLLAVAAQLAAERPTDPMTAGCIDALALTFATRRHGYGTAAADRAETQVLVYAPIVITGTTRSQYAEELRQAAGGGQ